MPFQSSSPPSPVAGVQSERAAGRQVGRAEPVGRRAAQRPAPVPGVGHVGTDEDSGVGADVDRTAVVPDGSESVPCPEQADIVIRSRTSVGAE
jgi:hypothetical protein